MISLHAKEDNKVPVEKVPTQHIVVVVRGFSFWVRAIYFVTGLRNLD